MVSLERAQNHIPTLMTFELKKPYAPTPPKTNGWNLKMMVSNSLTPLPGDSIFRCKLLVFRCVKNTGVPKKHKHTKLQCIIHHPSLAPFFLYSGRFPKSVAFFLLVRFSQPFVEIWKPSSSKSSKRQLEIYFNGGFCFRFQGQSIR